MRISRLAFVVAVVGALGCGDDDASDGNGDGPGGVDGGADQTDSGSIAEEGWDELIKGSWTLPVASGENPDLYKCVRKTVTETVWINAFKPVAPNGTHHTVLTVGPSDNQPDGIFDCDFTTNHDVMIFGSGVGTNELALPEGVAVKIEAGQQLMLNLHLFNATDNPLPGTSGTLIKTMTEAEVVHEAEAVLTGSVAIYFSEPGMQKVEGSCTMGEDVTLLSVSPHMHKRGRHMKVVANSTTAGAVTLLDEDYSFDDQFVRLLATPVAMKKGDKVNVTCTYDNGSGGLVTIGESTNNEMCFAGVFRYPKLADGFTCTN